MANATFEAALRKMMKLYWSGKDSGETEKLGERKYTKKYFDGLTESVLGEKPHDEEEDD